MAAFRLLEAERGPLLADYPEDVPPTTSETDDDAMTGMVCPIDLPKMPDETAPSSEIGIALLREVASLMPWHQLAVQTRGRTTVGPSGLSVEEAGKFLAAILEDEAAPPPRTDMAPGRVLKFAFEDLKAFYGEAITAQPGFTTSKRVEDWLFNETVLGTALWRLRDVCAASADDSLHDLSRNSIVPDRQINPAS
jgi:D-proline reductase (dithiol) PrdB